MVDPMRRRQVQVDAVRRRLFESKHALGISMLHDYTHLHRDLIVDVLQLVADHPDPPMFVRGLYDAWKKAGETGFAPTGYMDFMRYARHRIGAP